MPDSAHFHTTRWTLVQQSHGGDTKSKQALSDLCASYYKPVVMFVWRSGFEETRARDLAHDFFARLLNAPEMLQPRRELGRFRSYLLGAVRHFVSDALDRERAGKRGGSSEHVEVNDEVLSAATNPAREFDRQWALTVVDHALERLQAEFTAAGKESDFDLLKPWLMGDDDATTQASIAAQLGMNEGAVKVAIHRLRKRFRELVKSEVSHTVGSEEDVKEELAHLLGAI